MPTISIKSSKIIMSALLLACAQAHAADLAFCLPDGAQIKIELRGKSPAGALEYRHRKQDLQIEPDLRKELSKADEAFVLSRWPFTFEAAPAFAVVTRTASRSQNTEGYCGAGHEDHILLVSIDKDVVRLRDKVLVQSCLESISLVSDRGDSPREALSSSIYPEVARFQISTPPDFEISDKRVIIKNNKLVIEDVEQAP